jgi:hypothetical protein
LASAPEVEPNSGTKVTAAPSSDILIDLRLGTWYTLSIIIVYIKCLFICWYMNI